MNGSESGGKMEAEKQQRGPDGNGHAGLASAPRGARTETPSAVRAWFFLIWLSFQRQARTRQLTWMALGLMLFATALVALTTAADGWSLTKRRFPRGGQTLPALVDDLHVLTSVAHSSPGAQAIQTAVFGSWRLLLTPGARTEEGEVFTVLPFQIFSAGVVFTIFIPFLLPVWSLAFATEALGGERESGTLVWLLTRPLPRASIYLAKFLALLPWSVGFNLFGFTLLCLAAGAPGWQAWQLYWPGVAMASVTFSALFFLLGAVFRWPAVLGMVYSFCLEVVLGSMPGYMKRVSIGFYTRCMLYESAEQAGYMPENPAVFLPVSGLTALAVLMGAAAFLVVVGMMIFSQMQFNDQV